MSSQKELAYRIFVTDALRNIAKNTAINGGNGGEYPSKRFAELIRDFGKDESDVTKEEIVSRIKGSLRRLANGSTS